MSFPSCRKACAHLASAPQPEPVEEAPQRPAHGIGEDSDDEDIPRVNVEPPTPLDRTGITPFRDYPDDYEPEDDRSPHDMLDEQQEVMNGQCASALEQAGFCYLMILAC